MSTGGDSIGIPETAPERAARLWRAYALAKQAADAEREALISVSEEYKHQASRQDQAADEYNRAARAPDTGWQPVPSGRLCGWHENQFHWPSFYIDLYRRLAAGGLQRDADPGLLGYLDAVMAELIEGRQGSG